MQTVIGKDIKAARDFLMAGDLVALPTETVYGLAANALNEAAVIKIYEAKSRPRFNPLIVHVGSVEQLRNFTTWFSPKAQTLASHFMPGPLSLLLPKSQAISDLVTAGSNLVALRIPDHPLTLSLLHSIDFPLAAPSANPSGYISPTTAQHVYESLSGRIPYILDGGACGVGLESTIVGFDELERPVLYRQGGVPAEAIAAVLGEQVQYFQHDQSLKPKTAGQLKSHYAPHKPLYFGNVEALLDRFQGRKIYVISFQRQYSCLPGEQQFILSPSGNLATAAQQLFSVLRVIDQTDADLIIAEVFPNEGLGVAINDRLRRAQEDYK